MSVAVGVAVAVAVVVVVVGIGFRYIGGFRYAGAVLRACGESRWESEGEKYSVG